jgi:GTP pyrophosphokinase
MEKEKLRKTESDEEFVERARRKAEELHRGQLRKSGEPYFTHLQAVHDIIFKEWKIKDPVMEAAAYLHDTDEDTDYKLDQLEKDFGKEAALLVDGVTKLKEKDKETLVREVKMGKLDDIRILFLKSADRLHNMRTLEYVPADKQYKKAEETMRTYTKVAKGFGMWLVKTELEDLSYKYLYPKEYKELAEKLEKDGRRDKQYQEDFSTELKGKFTDQMAGAKITVREGGMWNIAQKAKKRGAYRSPRNWELESISDVVTFRIEVDDWITAAGLFGQINADYVAIIEPGEQEWLLGPKRGDFGYQALQTVINTAMGKVKIAVVTHEAADYNDLGLVSLLNQKGKISAKDYRHILVFTEDGDLLSLPEVEPTGWDLAAAIHPSLMAGMIGMILLDNDGNPTGDILPPGSPVHNGERIKIESGKPRTAPSPEALKESRLPSTRRLIREQLARQKDADNVDKGREMVNEFLAKRQLPPLEYITKKVGPFIMGGEVQEFYKEMGEGIIRITALRRALGEQRITAETMRKNFGVCCFWVGGRDRPGIMAELGRIVGSRKGTIVAFNQEMAEDDSTFELSIVVKGLSLEEEEKVREEIAGVAVKII